jgi:hypothetical protein
MVPRGKLNLLISALDEPHYQNRLTPQVEAAYRKINKILSGTTDPEIMISQKTADILGVTTIFFRKAPPIA